MDLLTFVEVCSSDKMKVENTISFCFEWGQTGGSLCARFDVRAFSSVQGTKDKSELATLNPDTSLADWVMAWDSPYWLSWLMQLHKVFITNLPAY